MWIYSTLLPSLTFFYAPKQHMTLVLSSFLHTCQVNDTWQLFKAKSMIEKAHVITLSSVFVCSICPPKSLSSTLVKKKAEQHGKIECVLVVKEA